MLSSTTVVTSAARACTIHDSGNIWLRSRAPATYVSGITARATRVRPTWIDAISTTATAKLTSCRVSSGANVQNICTERMSELAREISCPACTVS